MYFPSNLEVTVTNDQSEQIRETVSNLENSIIFGVILVVLVLLFFLGLRNALFVGIAIPLSMFLSFIILDSHRLHAEYDGTLLTGTRTWVCLWIMVSWSWRMSIDLMDEGMERKKAAMYGVGEVAMPIIASTATTLSSIYSIGYLARVSWENS